MGPVPTQPIELVVNGRPVSVPSDANTSLGMVLRNELGLRGTRLGCEEGACGACTVVVEGRAVQSCSTTIESVRNKKVLTIDALVADDPPHPLVEALLSEHAGQCGFCLAGIVMAAFPLYGCTADRGALRKALERNLCRCGSQQRILDALDHALTGAKP